MVDALKAKKPVPYPDAKAPDTLEQTKLVEEKLSPQHNTTESYGKAEDKAERKKRR